MPSFYNGKRFFLTYPQCEALPHELASFLTLSAECTYLIAREKHEKGGHHLHACVEFTETQRHDMRWLDFQGKHPNKQDPRKWAACQQYCKKDGDYIEGPEDALQRRVKDGLAPHLACAEYEKRSDWVDYCISQKIGYQYMQDIWLTCHGANDSITTNDHPGTLCPSLATFAWNSDLHRCLILHGPSGCGKTVWAKRNIPKPSLFVRHIDQLKGFVPGYHVSIIFDDCDFKHYPRVAQIHLCDFHDTSAIHCRHAVAIIPAGVFKLFTCNELPLSVDDPAIRRRVRVVHIQT